MSQSCHICSGLLWFNQAVIYDNIKHIPCLLISKLMILRRSGWGASSPPCSYSSPPYSPAPIRLCKLAVYLVWLWRCWAALTWALRKYVNFNSLHLHNRRPVFLRVPRTERVALWFCTNRAVVEEDSSEFWSGTPAVVSLIRFHYAEGGLTHCQGTRRGALQPPKL